MANKYAGPVQGKVRLVMDVPKELSADKAVEALELVARTTVLPEVVLALSTLRAVRVVEAKPGHTVIALPLEGSTEADALVEACAEAAFYALPGRPPIPWQKFRAADLAGAFGIKKAVLAVLTAAGAFVDKEGGAK